MTRQNLTMCVMGAAVGCLILYDVWAAFVPGATISEVTLHLAHKHPIIPFALGVLCGHFFWSQAAEAHWQNRDVWIGSGPVKPHWHLIPLAIGLALLGLGLSLAAMTLARGY